MSSEAMRLYKHHHLFFFNGEGEAGPGWQGGWLANDQSDFLEEGSGEDERVRQE